MEAPGSWHPPARNPIKYTQVYEHFQPLPPGAAVRLRPLPEQVRQADREECLSPSAASGRHARRGRGRALGPGDSSPARAPPWVPGRRASPVEGLHVAVLGRHRHAAQVRLVAHRLEVAAAQQQVDGPRAAPLRQRQRLVDLVQLPVAAAGHGHAHPAGPVPGAPPAAPESRASPAPRAKAGRAAPLPPTGTEPPPRPDARNIAHFRFQLSRDVGRS